MVRASIVALGCALVLACTSKTKTAGGPGSGGSAGATATGGASGGGGGGAAGAAGAAGGPVCDPSLGGLPGKQLVGQSFNAEADLDAPTPGTAQSAPSAKFPFEETLEPSDFGPGLCDQAAWFQNSSKRVRYPEVDGSGTTNIDYTEGTLRFWYKPSYAASDAQDHELFRSSNLPTRGGLRLLRTKNHSLKFEYFYLENSVSMTAQAQVDLSSHFQQDQWTHLTVDWHVGDLLRVFIDGVEVAYGEQQTVPASANVKADAAEAFTIGYYAAGSPDSSATGWIDEFQIWDGRGP